MPELQSISITPDDAKAELVSEVAKVTADKTVQDFVSGKTAACADAKCTYDANGGWVTLPDKSMHHEVDREIVKKYELCKTLRPDIVKPPYDSFYYHTDGDKVKKLLTHDEMLAVIAAQDYPDDIGGV